MSAETAPDAGLADWEPEPAGVYFSDRFEGNAQTLETYGAPDISVVTDMPWASVRAAPIDPAP